MSQLKVNAIRHTGASSDAIELNSDGSCTAKVTNNLSNRNLIINGAMNVAQRSQSSTSGGYTVIDRWQLNDNNTNVTITQSQHALTSSDTGPWAKGFRNSYSIALSAAGNGLSAASYCQLKYMIEAQDIACSGWDYTSASSYITFSFWFKCSTNQTFHARWESYDGTAQNYPFSFTATGNDTWTKITKTIPGNTNITVNNDTGAGLGLSISLFSGTDRTGTVTLNQWGAFSGSARHPDDANTWITAGASTFEITGVQLEVGDTATEFEHLSYADELRRCHRYFHMIVDPSTDTYSDDKGRQPFMQGLVWNKDTKDCRFRGTFNVPMRASPSLYKVVGTAWFRIQVVGGVNTTSDWTLLGSWKEFFELKCTAIDAFGSDDNGMSIYAVCFNSGARVGWDAEL